MGNVWFTSDPHFGHANIISYCARPYTDVNHMNEMLILNWNAVVQPEDTVYVLGDFSMSLTYMETVTPRLNGKKILICGNHDHCHPAHHKGKTPAKQEAMTAKYLAAGFSEVHLELHMELSPEIGTVKLYHLPYTDPVDMTNGMPRHSKFRLKDEGIPMLCGHVHQSWLFKRTDKGTPMLNIGIDAPVAVWQQRPASLKEVIDAYIEQTRSG